MDIDRRGDGRSLRLSCGSATLEGLAAIAIGFVLLALMVQVVALVATRHRAVGIAHAAAAEASMPDAETAGIARATVDRVERLIPGASRVQANVIQNAREVAVRIRFRWIPPGPAWVPVWVGATATATRVVPP